MITKAPYGLSPTVEVTIGNASVDYSAINRIELTLEENCHDMLVFELAGIPPRAITDYYGRPVRVVFSTGGNFYQTFHGYVEDVRPKAFTGFGLMNKSPFQEARIVCMGASYSMRGSRSKTWVGYKLSDIAREMAAKYGFSLDVPSDSRVHEGILQTNESDWQFLSRYATMLGYSLTAHNTHMHLYDPYAALSRQISYHILPTLNKTRGKVTPSPGQIIEFSGSFANRHIDGYYKDSILTVVNDDNTVFDVTTNTLEDAQTRESRFKNRVAEHVHNFSSAEKRIDAISKQDYDYYADVTVLGLAGCLPGGIVNVDNYNGKFDGFWYVQGVKHIIHSNTFYTELRIAKNLNSELAPTNTQKYTYPPTPRYTQNGWIADTRTVNEYS